MRNEASEQQTALVLRLVVGSELIGP